MHCAPVSCPNPRKGLRYIAIAWTTALRNKLKGAALKSGSFLGALISSCLRKVNSTVSFYPEEEEYFSSFFVSVVEESGKWAGIPVESVHVQEFYMNNRASIEKEIVRRIDTHLDARLKILLDKFQTFPNGKNINSIFSTPALIDSGEYRRTEGSPIGDLRFTASVIAAFQLPMGKVSLEQLAFASVSFILKFKQDTIPELCRKFSISTAKKISEGQRREMNFLMCVSTGTQLARQCTTTDNGWLTNHSEVFHTTFAVRKHWNSYR